MHRRFAVAFVALALFAGACGGKGNGEADKVSAKRKTSTTLSDTTTTTDRSVADDESTSTSSANERGGSAGTTPAGKSVAPKSTAAPKPAQQGTYDYAQSGSTSQGQVPPQGSLVVTGSGSSEVFSRYFDPSEPPSDVYFDFGDNGPFITKVVVRASGVVITCAFASPVPAPPWPADDGATFSGHATCDNGFAADFSGSITGHQTDTVGGRAVAVAVVDSNLHIVGGGIDVNTKDTQHWAPSLRVPTYSHEVISGSGPFGIPITGDVTATLTSTSPR
jgi:hypothetical protein